MPDSIAPFVNHYNGVLLANHGALTWGDDIYQAFYRLESVEYYATILMYTGNIIGQQNHLSCEQVDRLLEIRKNMGITGGGVPPCMNGGQLTKVCESCAAAGEKTAAAGTELAGGSCGGCAAAGGTQTGPQAPLKGVTPLVRPGDAGKMPGGGLGAGSGSPSTGSGPADKDALIAEIVRRVVVQLKA